MTNHKNKEKLNNYINEFTHYHILRTNRIIYEKINNVLIDDVHGSFVLRRGGDANK